MSIIARRWHRDGIEVRHLYGTDGLAPADVAILHVDLSVVPDRYAAFARRYPRTVNAGVLDIRKRRFSTLALSEPGSYRGEVIVKTDLNAGGEPERAVGLTRRALARLARAAGVWPRPRAGTPPVYKVYRSPEAVPRRYFRGSDYVVERFLPERRGELFCHRRYYFLGEAEVNQVWVGTERVCSGDVDGEPEEVPIRPELRRFRRSFGIDFGKIDYLYGPSGDVIILDVNKTPWGETLYPEDLPWLEQLCVGLERGIDGFLPRASAASAPPASPGAGSETAAC